MKSTASRFAAVAAAMIAIASCRCGKDEPHEAKVNGYAQLVETAREAGLADESTCEQPAWPEEAQRKHREMGTMFGSRPFAKAPIDALAKAPDDALVSEIRDRVFDKMMTRGTRGLAPPERAVWLYDLLDGEVNNGGFHQYFSNSSGDCALETLDALRAFEGSDVLRLYERAIGVFPASRPAADRRTRNVQMSRIPNEYEAWRTHDDAYYAMKDREAVVAKYLRAHLAELDLPPSP